MVIWWFLTTNKDLIQIWRRGYRTKGKPVPNRVPLPKITAVQREASHLVDLDVEILDSDDSTATFGVLVVVDGEFDHLAKYIVPELVEGTDAKIGTPVPTNTVHRLTWNPRGDWNSSGG